MYYVCFIHHHQSHLIIITRGVKDQIRPNWSQLTEPQKQYIAIVISPLAETKKRMSNVHTTIFIHKILSFMETHFDRLIFIIFANFFSIPR